MDDEKTAAMQYEAMKQALAQMNSHLKQKRAMRFAPKKAISVEKITMEPTEGGLTLDGLLNKKGNSTKDMAAGSDVPDDLKPGHDEIEMDDTDGGLTLDGIMNKKGNSGSDIAKELGMSDDEIMEALKGAH